jgi:excisionase family DNA binding protein
LAPYFVVWRTLSHFGTDGKQLISLDEAATQVGASRRTIQRLFNTGELTKYKRHGDRRTFVDQDQLTRLFGFREVGAEYDAKHQRRIHPTREAE